ncbi:MAG: c-type cytochrome [Pseudomonadota bacterium]|nr:c-type cytochrome [Pseudomonadota bacterium]
MKFLMMTGTLLFCMSIHAAEANVDADIASENKAPTKVILADGKLNYQRYCSTCHGYEGQGGEGPTLIGSLIVTGPMANHIDIVLHGKRHMKMPSWGITELSDDMLAKIVTYQRNAWGNDDKQKFGKHAGGVVSPQLLHQHRKTLDAKPVKEEVRA